jgi:hypothetical protein
MERFTGNITIRDVLLGHDNWLRFLDAHDGRVRPVACENVRRMLNCRTPALGFHLYECPGCGNQRVIPHSCKSRLCSSCGKVATDRWADQVLNDTLDVPYHHLVFTIPWQFRVLALRNRKKMLNILFRSAADAVLEWCRTYEQFTPGLIAVLHTFGGDLKFHPHVHVLVTAGGLHLDKQRWVRRSGDYLMPEAGLKKRWRYQVTTRINAAYRAGELEMPMLSTGPMVLARVIHQVLDLIWYVMIGTSLRDLGFTVRYIGRYTRRPVIAESRLIRFDDKWVVFRYKDYANDGQQCVKKLPVFQFIERLLRHVPDKHFRMTRHYGLFATRVRSTTLPLARRLLSQPEPAPQPAPTWRERRQASTGVDPLQCERCGREMELVGHFFGRHAELYAMLCLSPGQQIDPGQTVYQDTG